jgi:hypothetical protein
MHPIIQHLERIPHQVSISITLIIALFCSFLVFGLYGIHAIDDAWTLSFDYFYYYEGFEFDRVFERGLGIVAYFGKIHAYLYGTILDVIGWKRANAQLISITLIIASAWLWYRIAFLCGYEKYYAMAVGVLILLLDPFMSVAHKARPEALTFFLLSLSIYSLYRKQFLLAGIIAGLSIENHPMGAISLAYILAFIFSQYGIKSLLKQKRILLKIAAGLVASAVFYLILHGEHLNNLLTHAKQGDGSNIQEKWFLYQHFFESRFHRHLPEFFIWLFVVFIFLYKKLYTIKNYQFAFIALISVFLFSLLISHGNKQYGLYLYPAFILITLSVVQYYKKLTILLLFFCALMLPQYAFVYWKFKGFDFAQYTKIVHNITPKNNLPIWGHPNHWFAFNDRENNTTIRNFHTGEKTASWQKTNQLIYIRDLEFEKYQPLRESTIKLLDSKQSHLLHTQKYLSHTIKVYQIDKTPL